MYITIHNSNLAGQKLDLYPPQAKFAPASLEDSAKDVILGAAGNAGCRDFLMGLFQMEASENGRSP